MEVTIIVLGQSLVVVEADSGLALRYVSLRHPEPWTRIKDFMRERKCKVTNKENFTEDLSEF